MAEGYSVRLLRELRKWARGAGFDIRHYAKESPSGDVYLCLAAKAVVDAGAELVWGPVIPGVGRIARQCSLDGETHEIHDLATRLCGLTSEEGDVLFAPETGSIADNEGCALAFLDYLIYRGENRTAGMETGQAEGWKMCWMWENLPAERD